MMISCPEEIAYRLGYITADQLRALGEAMSGNQYGRYLMRLAEDEDFPFHGV
jgi:glucose-1-phosphate thymidylyltransferase